MVLSGIAAGPEVDCERIQFAPFAFEWAPPVPLMFDHTVQVAGRIESLEHNSNGELVISAYVNWPGAIRCNAYSVGGDVLQYSLHRTDSVNFYARITKMRLREISMVSHPVQRSALVKRREPPSPLSNYAASKLKQYDLSIEAITRMQKLATSLRGAT